MSPRLQGRTRSVSLLAEVLTPTHVGTGALLRKSEDFVLSRGRPYVAHVAHWLASAPVDLPDLDAKLLRGITRLEDLAAVLAIPERDLAFGYPTPPLCAQQESRLQEMRQCLKDAFQNPILPGSSLKGALRTAFLASRAQAAYDVLAVRHLPRGRGKGPSFADDDLDKACFGADPNHDLLRAFKVSDARFAPASLRLLDIRWVSLKGGRGRYRNIAVRNAPDEVKYPHQWRDAQGIFAEGLAPGALGEMRISWDDFLLSDPAVWNPMNHVRPDPAALPRDLDGLRKTLNDYAAWQLQREIDFFQRCGVAPAQRSCEALLQEMADRSEAIYLRLSWGSGWRGMTGDWLKEADLERMRSFFRLGRDGQPFPKTRRLAVDGAPRLPMGWIRLWSGEAAVRLRGQGAAEAAWLGADAADVGEARLDGGLDGAGEAAVGAPMADGGGDLWAREAAPAPQTPAEEWLAQALEEMQPRFRDPDQALMSRELAEQWRTIGDVALREEALRCIRERWLKQVHETSWDRPPSNGARRARRKYDEPF